MRVPVSVCVGVKDMLGEPLKVAVSLGVRDTLGVSDTEGVWLAVSEDVTLGVRDVLCDCEGVCVKVALCVCV